MSGPVPKKSSERRRRNAPDKPMTTITPGTGEKLIIPAEDQKWHPIVKGWWRSLKTSPQCTGSFVNSDWAAARLTAETMHRMLTADKLSAELLKQVWSMMGDLLTTEGQRRRLRVEIDRALEGGDGATVTSMSAYRDVLGN